ncbi:MAG: nucleoid occlusion protein [Clostridia bacterium]|nr:nucleoid occlusion protein [Clostridia bacterium]
MARGPLSKILGLEKDDKKNQINEIEISLIKTNPFQPRKNFDPVQLEELAKSIQEYGIIQPLILREKQGSFELIAGERRLRAAQNIGMTFVPAIIKEYSDKEMAEVALIENLQREDLNYFEEAEGYKKLIDEFSLKQEEIARRMGKRQSTIANKLRLLKLPEEVRQNIVIDIVTERHARALLKLPDAGQQLRILKEIYDNELNVRETDMLVEETLNHLKIEEKSGPKKRIVRVFKDMRIYLNALKSTVGAIETAGLDVKMEEKDCEDYIQVEIKIYKQHTGKQ